MEGIIVKGIGGFYYVEAAEKIYECKARGIFRKNKITPLVGDRVCISVNENAENTIDEILPRKNSLTRPPLANVDLLFIVSSIVDPVINPVVLDKLIAVAELKHIEPIIVITKSDLDDSYKKYEEIYKNIGFETIVTSIDSDDNIDRIKELLTNHISAFTGNTGVGKTTILNKIFPHLDLETGETSKKLGRGKHTTRQCELFKVNNGYVADTPGFSSLDIERYEQILKEDLPYCFREFVPLLGSCKFSTCAHIKDKGCKIVEAVNNGDISVSRHDSYVQLYNEVKDLKEWNINK